MAKAFITRGGPVQPLEQHPVAFSVRSPARQPPRHHDIDGAIE
jgi:hypothetical protein